jgi:DNA-binding transcriptional ArsR family regulator
MADVKRPNRLDETAIAERRKKVSQLYLRHQNQYEIARALGVSQQTVSLDIAALREAWKAEGVTNFDQVKEREAVELDEMEAEAAIQFSRRQNWEWFDRRIKVKERRARMLGLDAPVKTDSNVNVRTLSDEELIERAKGVVAGDGAPGLDPGLIERAIAKRDELGE